MKSFTITAALVAAASAANLNKTKFEKFIGEWVPKFSQHITNEGDFLKIEHQWFKSEEAIEAHNNKLNKQGRGIKLGHNKYSGMTNEEFAAQTAGVDKAQFDDAALKKGFKKNESTGRRNLQANQSVNWHLEGKTGDVRDQGTCAGCYAFSTTLTVASTIAIQHETPYVALSEQQIIDCSKQGNTTTPYWSYNQGCGGGWMQGTFNHMQMYGLMAESDYPYTSGSTNTHGACQYNQNNLEVAKNTVSYAPRITNLNDALAKIQDGTIDVGIKIMCDEFRLYESGVMTYADTAHCTSGAHAAVIIGYDTGDAAGRVITSVKTCDPATADEIANNQCSISSAFMQIHETELYEECCTETVTEEAELGQEHWILQNSYGTGWGEGGFMKIAVEEGYGAFQINTLMEHVNV